MEKKSKIERALAIADENFWPAVTLVAIVTYAFGCYSLRDIFKRAK